MDERPLTWLHLTDLDIRAEKTFVYDLGLTRLVDFVKDRTLSGELKLDFVFCTGDLAFSGSAKEYATVKVFFNRLSEAARLPLSKIFTVPGNHDFNRARRRSHFRIELESNADAEKFFSSPEDFLIAQRPFQDYLSFEEEVFGRTWENNYILSHSRVDGMRIAVLGLNTALLAERDECEGRLVVGRSTVERALAATTNEKPDFTIVLLHHPPSFLAPFEREGVRKVLSKDADFVLHGHVHAVGSYAASPNAAVFLGIGSERETGGRECLSAEVEEGRIAVRRFRFEGSGAGAWKPMFGEPEYQPLRSRPQRRRRSSDESTADTISRYPFDVARYSRYLNDELGSVILGGLGRLHAPTLPLQELFIRTSVESVDSADSSSQSDALNQDLDITSLLRKHSRVLLLGPPGSGKTTLLNWLALNCARRLTDSEPTETEPRWIPVLIRLRELSGDWPRDSQEDVIKSAVCGVLTRFGADEGWANAALGRGDTLLLLDGLDEIFGSEDRRYMMDAIERFASRFPRAPMILSSRTGYSDSIILSLESQFSVYHLRPFSPHQVAQFVRAAYRALGSERKGVDQSDDLLRAIENVPFLQELSHSPLLLWTVVLSAWNLGAVPRRRVDLYSGAVSTLISTWDRAKGIERNDQLGAEHTMSLLQSIALAAHSREASSFSLEDLSHTLSRSAARHVSRDFITTIQERTGLITEQGPNRWQFSHRTLQEFLASQAVLEDDRPDHLLSEHLADPSWRELVLFAISSMEEKGRGRAKRLFEILVHRASQFASRQKRADALGVLAAVALESDALSELVEDSASLLRERLSTLIADSKQPGSLWARVQMARLLGRLCDSDSTSIETVAVPAGPFLMGSPEPSAPQLEKPARTVFASTFFLSIYPVTNAQFLRFIESGGYSKERYWAGGVGQRTDHRALAAACRSNPSDPVTNVSWFEAEAYCRWLNDDAPRTDGARWRLPTEAEWEKGARGASEIADSSSTERRGIYPWGEKWSRNRANGGGVYSGVTPVGLFPSGRGPYGALDQVGNVAEWCQDGLWRYGPDRLTDPLGMTSSAVRVARGGDWASPASDLRVSARAFYKPTERSPKIGFRCIASSVSPIPTRPPNPFRPGIALPDDAPPPGRLELISGLTARIAQGGSSVLLGPRRSGKTSILRYLFATLADRQSVRFLDLQGHPCRTPDVLAASLEPSLSGHPNPAEEFRRIVARETQPVILIDELGRLRHAEVDSDPNVFEWLRSIGQEGVSLILAGTLGDWEEARARDAEKPGSSFTNILKPLMLGPLSEPDAVNFLVDTLPDDLRGDRDSTARWIVHMTGAWPFYLQVVAHAYVEEARAGKLIPNPLLNDIRRIYEEALLDEYEFIFRQRWMELPPHVRRILLQGEDGQLPEVARLSPADIASLEKHGLYDQRKGWVLLLDVPFCDWFRAHRRGLTVTDTEVELG